MQFIRRSVFFCTLSFFLFFIGVGNFFRLAESSLFSDGWLISEIVLYTLCLISISFLSIPSSHILHILGWNLCIGISFAYGCGLHGFDIAAALYALRWMGALLSVYVLFRLCYMRFAGSIASFFSYLCLGYSISLCLGFVLYIFFPQADRLWLWLEQNRIGFYGDPHVGRFVSVYFDPNYYAAIVGLMVLMGIYLYQTTRRKRWFFFTAASCVSGLLTWSRSGIAALAALLVLMLFFRRERGILSVKRISLGLISLVGTLGYVGIFFEETKEFLERIIFFFTDDSALYRWDTWQFGWRLFQEYPFFGIGINFLHQHAADSIGLNSVDSSLLSLLVQIGGVPLTGLVGYMLYKLLAFRSYHRRWQSMEETVPYFFMFFWSYGLIECLFASQFNNVLFYPFWMIPFGVTALFLQERCKQKMAKELYV